MIKPTPLESSPDAAEDWSIDAQMAERQGGQEVKQWFYRVLENDDEGDPLDFGAVSADNFQEAKQLVTAHLVTILGEFSNRVRFYDITSTVGVFETENYKDVRLKGQ